MFDRFASSGGECLRLAWILEISNSDHFFVVVWLPEKDLVDFGN